MTERSGLTSAREVNFVSVCLEGEQHPCFRGGCCCCCAAGTGRLRGVTTWVSILVDPLFIKASAGSTHLESSQTNQPATREPFVWTPFPGYDTYLDTVTTATVMDEFVTPSFLRLASLLLR